MKKILGILIVLAIAGWALWYCCGDSFAKPASVSHAARYGAESCSSA